AWLDALGKQVAAHGVGSLLGQLHIVGVTPDVVGVALHFEIDFGVVIEHAHNLVEDPVADTWPDDCLVELELNLLGDSDLLFGYDDKRVLFRASRPIPTSYARGIWAVVVDVGDLVAVVVRVGTAVVVLVPILVLRLVDAAVARIDDAIAVRVPSQRLNLDELP